MSGVINGIGGENDIVDVNANNVEANSCHF